MRNFTHSNRNLLFLVLLLTSCLLGSVPVYAADPSGSTIASYSETFSPAQGKDALWQLEATGSPAADGFIYVPLNPLPAKDKAASPAKLQNVTLAGAPVEFKELKIGEVAYLQVKATGGKGTLKAERLCPGFFAPKKGKLSTGIPEPQLTYKFTNQTATKLGKYNIKILFPSGLEPMTITAPASVTAYQLGSEKGQRSFFYELKKGLAPAAAATVTMTFGSPFTAHTGVLIALWLVIIAISVYVIKRRWQEYQ